MYKSLYGLYMVLKWGSTTVTAIKWGSTTCTAVYWGSTKVFPSDAVASLTSAWCGVQANVNGSWKYGLSNATSFKFPTSGTNVIGSVSGKSLSSSNYSGGNTTANGEAGLVTNAKIACTGTVTLTVNVTAKGGAVYLLYGSNLPTAKSYPSTTSWSSGYTIKCNGNPSATGTFTQTASISGSYYLWVCAQSCSFTVTSLTY